MRKLMFAALLALAPAAARADFVTATFEDRYPGANSTAIDFRPADSFTSNGFAFTNHYAPPSGNFSEFYSGFGVSSRIDNVPVNDPFGSSDYNQAMGAYSPQPVGQPGTGAGGSPTYAVAFNYYVGDAVVDVPIGYTAWSIDVANTTYMASSALYGDAFSRPFASGDYVRLDIVGFAGAGATGAQVGTVSFYLADYRNGGSTLIDRFTTVDLSSLLGAQSLGFLVDSNVTNQFGVSVPFTFAIDNVVATNGVVPEPSGLVMIASGAVVLAAVGRKRLAA